MLCAAYIPRGVVHQAHTAREDLTGKADDPYQQASMHLTFGIELAKDASVEMLLHHYIASLPLAVIMTMGDSLRQKQGNNESTEVEQPLSFESDNGKISFQCVSSGAGASGISAGGIQREGGSGVAWVTCSEKDVLHLLLAAVAGFISAPEDAFVNATSSSQEGGEGDESFLSTSLLRKAVGVTTRTSELESLDPRKLLPEGLEVFGRGVRGIGVRGLLKFLVEKHMLRVSTVPVSESSDDGVCPTSLVSGDAGAGQDVELGESVEDTECNSVWQRKKGETLRPPSGSAQSYTTLGSDFSCSYIEGFSGEELLTPPSFLPRRKTCP